MAMTNSGRVQGLTVEIGGDTTKLDKALTNSNKEINNTQKALKDVERLLKLDPTNTELLAQKQKLLANKIDECSDRLKTLREAEQHLKEKGGIDENSEQFMGLRREILATEQELKNATAESEKLNSSFGRMESSLKGVSNKAGEIQKATEKASKVAQGLLAGATAFGVAAVKAYADYEQLIGGVETLFGNNADDLIKNANNAFKTAGLSANNYMETAIGFAASLVNSLGGNTAKAVNIADMAIQDMSDNANKMGNDMQSIQNAYQGFAKQNFNMLDNLRIGYNGSKEEMQRLLDTASRLAGVKFDIGNFSDIVQAIHVIQQEMGVTGTTAKEAEGTISGSINTLKAAFENLMAGVATDGANIEQLTNNLVEAFRNVADNILPIIETILSNLPGWAQFALVLTTIVAVISPVAGLIANITTAAAGLMKLAPQITAFISGLNGKAVALGVAFALLVSLITAIAQAWGDMSGLQKAVAILGALTAAALSAAMAMGVFNSAATMGAAAAGIIAGVAAVLVAVESAKASANKIQTSIPAFANGGTLSSGAALVGEAGPELLTVSNGQATVTPLTNNYTTNNITQASNQPIEVTLMLDRTVLAREMVNANNRAISLAGGSCVR